MKLDEWNRLKDETLSEIAVLRAEMEAKLAAVEERLMAKLEEAKGLISEESDSAAEKESAGGPAECPAVESKESPDRPPAAAMESSGGLDALIGLLEADDDGSNEEHDEDQQGEKQSVAEKEEPAAEEEAAPSAPHAEPAPVEAQGDDQAAENSSTDAKNDDEEEDDDDDEMPGLEEAASQEGAAAREEAVETAKPQGIGLPPPPQRPERPPRRLGPAKSARPASMWVAGAGSHQLAALQQKQQELKDKRRSTALASSTRERTAPVARSDGSVTSPLRQKADLMHAGRTQSIPNLALRPLTRGKRGSDAMLSPSSVADVEDALKVLAAAVFKGLLEVESSLEAQPPKKLKGFVSGRALASYLVRLLKLRSRNDASKLLNAFAPRYIMDATCEADSIPIIMDESAEWFGFKIPVFMFPEKLGQQLARATETVLGHVKFGPCDVSRVIAEAEAKSAADATADTELLRGAIEVSDKKAKKWHKRYAVLSSDYLRVYRFSDAVEVVAEHPIKSLACVTYTPAKSPAPGGAKAAQFVACFVVGDKRNEVALKTPSDSQISNDEWILAIDAAQSYNCALLSLLDATALSQANRAALLSQPQIGSDEITHGADVWTMDLANGKVRGSTAELGDMLYIFNGTYFYPPADSNQLHGIGHWDGLNLWWFETCSFDHRNAVKVPALRGLFVDADPVQRYRFDKARHLFVPAAPLEKPLADEDSEAVEVEGGGAWGWTGEDLARKDGTGLAWSVESSTPFVVVMLLQMLWDHAANDVAMPRGQLVEIAREEFDEPADTEEIKDGESADSGTDSEPSKLESLAEDSHDEEAKPVPHEAASINAVPYSSINAKQSRSSTSTKVKRNRRRSVKLTRSKIGRTDSMESDSCPSSPKPAREDDSGAE